MVDEGEGGEKTRNGSPPSSQQAADAREAPPPAAVELLAQRARLDKVRARLAPLLKAEQQARGAEHNEAPRQSAMLEAVRTRLREEADARAEGGMCR